MNFNLTLGSVDVAAEIDDEDGTSVWETSSVEGAEEVSVAEVIVAEMAEEEGVEEEEVAVANVVETPSEEGDTAGSDLRAVCCGDSDENECIFIKLLSKTFKKCLS